MPEVCEVTIGSQFLITKLKDCFVHNIHICSGKYTRAKLPGCFLLNGNLQVHDIDSKGKFMWFTFVDVRNNNHIYMMCTFGLTGMWSFNKHNNFRLQMDFIDSNNDVVSIYFIDPLNFGNIKFTNKYRDLRDKLKSLAPDFLKTKFDTNTFMSQIKRYKFKNMKIVSLLMEQSNKKGVGSGIGNYLVAEILYDARISPHRTISSLNDTEICDIAQSIKKIIKSCYVNYTNKYIDDMGDFSNIHINGIINGEFPNYHDDIDIDINKQYKLQIYSRKKDDLNNDVVIDNIVSNRKTYWVPNVQK